MLSIIKELHVPKVILRKIIMLLNISDIKKIILVVKELNILDNHKKEILKNANNGFI